MSSIRLRCLLLCPKDSFRTNNKKTFPRQGTVRAKWFNSGHKGRLTDITAIFRATHHGMSLRPPLQTFASTNRTRFWYHAVVNSNSIANTERMMARINDSQQSTRLTTTAQVGAGLRCVALTPRRTAKRPIFPKFGFPTVMSDAVGPSGTINTIPPKSRIRATCGTPHRVRSASATGASSIRKVSRVPIPTNGLMYCTPHLGDPCTLNCLDHVLGCGHKAFTTESQPCTLNCHIRDEPDENQIRDLDHSFICLLCIAEHIERLQTLRAASYIAELEHVARVNKKSVDWIREKLRYVAAGWRDQDVEEIKVLLSTKKGKMSQAMWLEPDFQSLLEVAVMEKKLRRRSSRSTLVTVSSRSSVADTITSPAATSPSTTVEDTLEAARKIMNEESPVV